MNNQKLCECGCGRITSLATYTSEQRGWVKGQPIRFIVGHRWNRNYFLKVNKVFKQYPSTPGIYGIREHVTIAEKALGKPLPRRSEVHHTNGKKVGGTLIICENRRYHLLLHNRERALKESGHANWLKCSICKKYDEPKNIDWKRYKRHPECINNYNKSLLLKKESG